MQHCPQTGRIQSKKSQQLDTTGMTSKLRKEISGIPLALVSRCLIHQLCFLGNSTEILPVDWDLGVRSKWRTDHDPVAENCVVAVVVFSKQLLARDEVR